MTDQEIKKIVREFRRGILNGKSPAFKCYEVSFPLQTFLQACGIDTVLTHGIIELPGHGDLISYRGNHYWLRMKDGRIIDATGSQFNPYTEKLYRMKLPPVYLGKKPDWYNTRKRVIYAKVAGRKKKMKFIVANQSPIEVYRTPANAGE